MTTTALIHPGEAQHAKRVLVINVTRIGDTLLATPALRAIAKYFPNAAITCLGHPKRVEVLKNISYLAKIGGITKNQAPFRGRLGSSRYDWAFVWGPDRPLYEYALRKATRVVGFRQNGAELDARLFHPQPEPPQNSRHAVAWYLALPESIGIPNDGYALDYALSDEERLWAKQRIAADIGRERPLVGLQVASFPTKAYRDWPIEHFVKVTKRIVNARPDARFVLFGSAGDRARALQFAHELPDRTSIYAGQLSLRETVAIMSEIDLYIGVDTGPTHLYGALRKSMVALYHPSLPSALYKPIDHPDLYVADHPLAGPGASREISMAEISVDMIWERVAAALQGEPSRFPGMPIAGVESPDWPGDPR